MLDIIGHRRNLHRPSERRISSWDNLADFLFELIGAERRRVVYFVVNGHVREPPAIGDR
jgi:hypothetical protein